MRCHTLSLCLDSLGAFPFFIEKLESCSLTVLGACSKCMLPLYVRRASCVFFDYDCKRASGASFVNYDCVLAAHVSLADLK